MKKVMKSGALILLIVSLSSSSIFGQEGFDKSKRARMQAKKIAFITNKLDLSPQEAEKFWPIYNKENEKIHAYFEKMRNSFAYSKGEEMSDEEALQQAKELIEIESKIIQSKKALIQQLVDVISGNKILLLMKSERDFRRNMMRGLKAKRMKNKKQAKGVKK